MLTAASAATALLAWKRAAVPAAVAGQSAFPDTALLNELIVIAVALADHAMAAGFRRIAKAGKKKD